jgi:hypothetical protein
MRSVQRWITNVVAAAAASTAAWWWVELSGDRLEVRGLVRQLPQPALRRTGQKLLATSSNAILTIVY